LENRRELDGSHPITADDRHGRASGEVQCRRSNKACWEARSETTRRKRQQGSRPHAEFRQRVGLGIAGPGLVRAGYGADLVAFDKQQIKPRLPTVEPGLPGVLKGPLAS
jgi:hypothetical protein